MQQQLEVEEAKLKQRAAMLQKLADEIKSEESQKLLYDTINQQMTEIVCELADLRSRRERIELTTSSPMATITTTSKPSNYVPPSSSSSRKLRPKTKSKSKHYYSDEEECNSEINLSMVTITQPNGEMKKFGIGDFVAVEPDTKRPDDVGRIEEIIPEQHMCKVRWLYRYRDLESPEAKRKFIPHTKSDLQAETVVLSDHYDICSIEFILRSVAIKFVGPKREYTCWAKYPDESSLEGLVPGTVEFVCLQDYPFLAAQSLGKGTGSALRSWTDGDIARMEEFAMGRELKLDEEESKPMRPAKRRKKGIVAVSTSPSMQPSTTTTTTTTTSVPKTTVKEGSVAKPPAVTADSKREEFIRLTKLQLESQVKANTIAPTASATAAVAVVKGEEKEEELARIGSEDRRSTVEMDDKDVSGTVECDRSVGEEITPPIVAVNGEKDLITKEIAAILGDMSDLTNLKKQQVNGEKPITDNIDQVAGNL